ncbi:MAG: hypothetical protein FWH41_01895 [Treponema sp.]|nr:hypothetical protein [Treponema sp.]
MKKIITAFILAAAAAGSVLAQVPQEDLWKNKALYAGASAGLGAILGPDGTVLGGSLSPLRLDWQAAKYFSLGTGLNFYFAPRSKYTAPKQTDPESGIMETYAGMETHILFPLLFNFTYRPGIFSVEIGGGPYVAPVTMNTTVERTNDNGYTVNEGYGKNLFTAESGNPFGFIVNGSFGVNVGRGILFLDIGYLRDFSRTTVKFKDEKIGDHLWNILAFNIGYKYGFFNSRHN